MTSQADFESALQNLEFHGSKLMDKYNNDIRRAECPYDAAKAERERNRIKSILDAVKWK